MITKRITMKFKEYRKRKNLTQKEVAEHLGCALLTYQRYESGERDPSIDDLKKISHLFGVPVDILIDNECGVLEKLTEEEKTFVEALRNAAPDARRYALVILNTRT